MFLAAAVLMACVSSSVKVRRPLITDQTPLGTKAVLSNTCNFTKPAPGAPALISFDNVTTMFHEFGHALNSLFSEARYPVLGGLPRDFGEVPSGFNEHWALEPQVFANYAKHYRTGERMPAAESSNAIVIAPGAARSALRARRRERVANDAAVRATSSAARPIVAADRESCARVNRRSSSRAAFST